MIEKEVDKDSAKELLRIKNKYKTYDNIIQYIIYEECYLTGIEKIWKSLGLYYSSPHKKTMFILSNKLLLLNHNKELFNKLYK